MMNLPRLALFGLLLSALCAPFSLLAQTASSLTGHVRAADGKFLAGVKVSVQNSGTTARREAVTGEYGRYVFAALAPGEYELRAEAAGFRLLKRAGIQTVGELVRKSESELNAIPNFGRKSIEEVQETLRARGLSLRAD
jgi:hypothetical protein